MRLSFVCRHLIVKQFISDCSAFLGTDDGTAFTVLDRVHHLHFWCETKKECKEMQENLATYLKQPWDKMTPSVKRKRPKSKDHVSTDAFMRERLQGFATHCDQHREHLGCTWAGRRRTLGCNGTFRAEAEFRVTKADKTVSNATELHKLFRLSSLICERRAADREHATASALIRTMTKPCSEDSAIVEGMVTRHAHVKLRVQQKLAANHGVAVGRREHDGSPSLFVVQGNKDARPRTKERGSGFPLLRRVRYVEVVRDHDGAARLSCSCPFFSMHGLPCRHCLAINGTFGIEDVAVRHHKAAVRGELDDLIHAGFGNTCPPVGPLHREKEGAASKEWPDDASLIGSDALAANVHEILLETPQRPNGSGSAGSSAMPGVLLSGKSTAATALFPSRSDDSDASEQAASDGADSDDGASRDSGSASAPAPASHGGARQDWDALETKAYKEMEAVLEDAKARLTSGIAPGNCEDFAATLVVFGQAVDAALEDLAEKNHDRSSMYEHAGQPEPLRKPTSSQAAARGGSR